MLPLLWVASTSWLRGRDALLLRGSESLCGPDRATSILANDEPLLLTRGTTDGRRTVTATSEGIIRGRVMKKDGDYFSLFFFYVRKIELIS